MYYAYVIKHKDTNTAKLPNYQEDYHEPNLRNYQITIKSIMNQACEKRDATVIHEEHKKSSSLNQT